MWRTEERRGENAKRGVSRVRCNRQRWAETVGIQRTNIKDAISMRAL